ncbi:hypothetical protein WAI453_002870 [Rhynchosporium graminicola]
MPAWFNPGEFAIAGTFNLAVVPTIELNYEDILQLGKERDAAILRRNEVLRLQDKGPSTPYHEVTMTTEAIQGHANVSLA